MKKSSTQWDKGFTLVEILIVAGMLSVVMTAVYSLYRTQQRSAYVQDDVVEVQQNLRIAMDKITADIRLSGLLLQPDRLDADNTKLRPVAYNLTLNDAGIGKSLDATGKPIDVASDSLTLNTVSSMDALVLGWIVQETPKITSDTFTVVVDSPQMVDRFTPNATNGDRVKIIRPENMGQDTDLARVFMVIAASKVNPLLPSLTLKQIITGEPGETPVNGSAYRYGDIVVKVPADAGHPCTVQYAITDADGTPNFPQGAPTCPQGMLCLARSENGNPAVFVVPNITNLQARFIKKGTLHLEGSDDPRPVNPLSRQAEEEVRTIQVTLTGLTTASVGMSDNGTKMRSLQSRVKLSNRK